MAWAVWLAAPIVATVITALFTWWRGRRQMRHENLDTAAAMLAHQDYLDALVIPARSSRRPTSVVVASGTVSPHLDGGSDQGPGSEQGHSAAG